MDGVLNIRKTSGPTSHDIVAQVRRIAGQKRVGHAGTLDPMATGVLVVCLGRATRIVEYLMDTVKVYRAKMVLGVTTDTEDATGAEVGRVDASSVTRADLEGAIRSFTGEIEQVPPMISAIKRQGRPLYDYARHGEEVERAPRKVTIHSISLLSFSPGSVAEAEIDVDCSSGTYIRTLCADIGAKLGCGAHMSALERTRVGRFAIEDSVTTESLAQAEDEGTLEQSLISISDALVDMPSAVVGAESASLAFHGLAAPANTGAGDGETVRIMGPDGLIGVGTVETPDGARLVKPRKVLVDAS